MEPLKIAFFGTKEYDRTHFKESYEGIEITFLRPSLSLETAVMAEGYGAVCVFVNDDLSAPVIEKLATLGVEYILLRPHVEAKSVTKNTATLPYPQNMPHTCGTSERRLGWEH